MPITTAFITFTISQCSSISGSKLLVSKLRNKVSFQLSPENAWLMVVYGK